LKRAKRFSSFSFASTAGSILVKHPAGGPADRHRQLSHYDAGNSAFPFANVAQTQIPRRGKLKPEVPLPDLLRRIGEDPVKLRWAILSHVHLGITPAA